ncbi:AraC family ligand binding domain-containing protein [Amycolatopsis sp. NPDC004368]
MVKNGQAIVVLPYRADVGVPPGVEVFDFRRLVARAEEHGVDPYAVRRPQFHQLIAVRSGTVRCSVDFTRYELGPGDWLWVRPGQVHRYDFAVAAGQGARRGVRAGVSRGRHGGARRSRPGRVPADGG